MYLGELEVKSKQVVPTYVVDKSASVVIAPKGLQRFVILIGEHKSVEEALLSYRSAYEVVSLGKGSGEDARPVTRTRKIVDEGRRSERVVEVVRPAVRGRAGARPQGRVKNSLELTSISLVSKISSLEKVLTSGLVRSTTVADARRLVQKQEEPRTESRLKGLKQLNRLCERVL